MADPVHIVCGHCDAVIRIPADRLADAPRCAKCHDAIFDGHPVEITGENFDKHVERNDLPVVVDFWAPWCGPCRAMAPAFESAASRYATQARLVKLNTDNAQETSARFGIRGIPTLIAFRHGREIARQSGAMDLPGPGTVFLSQNWKFTAPVFIEDTITAEAEGVSVHATKPVCQLRIVIRREGGETVLEGEAWCYTFK